MIFCFRTHYYFLPTLVTVNNQFQYLYFCFVIIKTEEIDDSIRSI